MSKRNVRRSSSRKNVSAPLRPASLHTASSHPRHSGMNMVGIICSEHTRTHKLRNPRRQAMDMFTIILEHKGSYGILMRIGMSSVCVCVCVTIPYKSPATLRADSSILGALGPTYERTTKGSRAHTSPCTFKPFSPIVDCRRP